MCWHSLVAGVVNMNRSICEKFRFLLGREGRSLIDSSGKTERVIYWIAEVRATSFQHRQPVDHICSCMVLLSGRQQLTLIGDRVAADVG